MKRACLQLKKVCLQRFAHTEKKVCLLTQNKPTANRHGKYSRQIATANSRGKFPRQIAAANSHGK